MSRQGHVRPWSRVLTVLLATGAGLTAVQASAGALTPDDWSAPMTGSATWFDNLGSPYGGCGMPQDQLETQNWIALNVYDTPGDYTMYPRPLPDGDPRIGLFDNGRNCGRWVRVSISDYCTGINDGAPGQPFCRGGSWVEDGYNGATLDMLVADSCGDPNGWCRDDPFHIDLAHQALNRFVQDGAPVGDLDDHWNNRRVTWEFIEAPDYSGDIEIGFVQGSERWWAGVSISRLPNGIHGVEHFTDGAWVTTPMNADMGQSYLVKPTSTGGTDYRIRVKDVDDEYLFGGREYSFSLPESCGGKCSAPRTVVEYTTTDGGNPTPDPTPDPTPTPTPTPTDGPACTATFDVVNAWPGGYQAAVTVTAGDSAMTSWTVTLTDTTASTVWNAELTGSGSSLTVRNAPYNGSVAAGGTTSFGFIGTGSPGTPMLTCAS